MDTREQILQTALRQFSRRGYHAVSIRDICGEVGIKESSLYYHFTNKRALLEALLERFAQKAAHFTRLLDEGTAQPAGMDDAAFLQVGEGYVQGYLLDPEILCFFGAGTAAGAALSGAHPLLLGAGAPAGRRGRPGPAAASGPPPPGGFFKGAQKMKTLQNFVITGGARGIGFHLALGLLQNGGRVAVLDLDVSPLQRQGAQLPSLLALPCDVRDAGQVAACVDRAAEEFGATEEEAFRQVLDTNYFGALHLARAALPHLRRSRGRLVFTSSGVGVTGFSGIAPYACSKGAIESLAKCLRLECAPQGVSVHLIHPPLTRTASAAPLPVPVEFMASPEAVGAGLARRIGKKSFLICHSAGQQLQMAASYLFPLRMGALMDRAVSRAAKAAK